MTDPDEKLQADVASLTEQVRVLSGRNAALERRLDLEIARTDRALGLLEGLGPRVEEYRAYRQTDAYAQAFDLDEPLVSVCIATVDRAQLLTERSVPSVLGQTYRNIEVVVVGDATQDDTAERLAALGDSRIRFENLPERGPYPRPIGADRWRVAGTNAMNRGLARATGHWVSFLDDDDEMLPERIATLITAAREHRADVLWHPFLYQDPDDSWRRLGNGRLERLQVTNGSTFFHRYFTGFPLDLDAYLTDEAGDWNRMRKIRFVRPRLHYVDAVLLRHHKERSQPPFVARPNERFLD